MAKVNTKLDRAMQVQKEIAKSPTFKKMEEMTAEDEAKWNAEIAALESRVKNEVEEVDLGDGTKIAIRLCLTDAETTRANYLESQQKVEKDTEKRAEEACELIALITANPLLTKEWLLANKDKYSPSDVVLILIGWMEVRLKERREQFLRLRSAMDFR